jgi:hypothetical protein
MVNIVFGFFWVHLFSNQKTFLISNLKTYNFTKKILADGLYQRIKSAG